jgi:translation initiation factor 5B
MTQLGKNSLSAKLYWELVEDKYKEYFPIVPTSGVTGEGLPDLLSAIIKYTNLYMKNRIKF